jgi:hypothetical protein
MIVIEITNIDDLVKDQKGWITAKIGSYVADLEAKVEEQVIEQILEGFEANGVKANIISVEGMSMSDVTLNKDWKVREIGG